MTPSFSDEAHGYIFYESIRNINVPRPFGIPNPMAYQLLCRCLADNWKELCKHFEDKTRNQKHKVSGLHIRKLTGKQLFNMNYGNPTSDDSVELNSSVNRLFHMNFKDWRTDGSPELDIRIGKRWLVEADISNCFPSIYSHSIPWALAGKDFAKKNRGKSKWFNNIDHFNQNTKNGETHGLLIGPHSSNLLSEIILSSIDSQLCDKWQYIRNIDDYTCYVSSYEEGQEFLADLNRQLRHYDLTLNHKKTKILELPIAAVKQWVRHINATRMLYKGRIANYKDVQAFLDSAVELMRSNTENSAILYYAIKTLKHQPVTKNAESYIVKTILHLAVLYPYLIPILSDYVFSVFEVNSDDIESFTKCIFDSGLENLNYEAVSFALLFAIKYNFRVDNIDVNAMIARDDTVSLLLAYKYFEHFSDSASSKILEKYAEDLVLNGDVDRHWVFVYEVLPANKLDDEWKKMKESNVTFIRPSL
jgi:hypothetical protein